MCTTKHTQYNMVKILFTDTHFGVKQNSMTWFSSQKSFIEDQLLPIIKQCRSEQDEVHLIHLGDVFDSRSTISTYIATEIVKIFKELRDNVTKFTIIGGNHDYYSPNTDKVDTLNLILKNLDIQLVTNKYEIDGEDLYMPWYEWLSNINNLTDIIKTHNIKNIYTHADIVTFPPKNIPARVFSGHIHTPKIVNNLYNLGSCYYLDFGDSNQERGIYIIKNNSIRFIPNTKSIKFWRLYDEDVFGSQEKYNPKDYFEIYISQQNLQDQKYIDVLSKYINTYKNSIIIPRYPELINENTDSENCLNPYGMENMIKELIPANLSQKFKMVLDKCNAQF